MTHTQFLAADPDASVWLGAHAGTGKTKVLVDRVLRLLLRNEPIHTLICITYTKAAASEMQSRIRSRLHQWTHQSDTELAQSLATLLGRGATAAEQHKARTLLCEVLDHPTGLNILTIHGFCQSLLARFPIEAGISPHFSVMEEATARASLNESKAQLLQMILRDDTEASLQSALYLLAERMGDSGIDALLRAIVADHALFYSLLERQGGRDRLIACIEEGLELAPNPSKERLIHAFSTRLVEAGALLLPVAKQLGSGKTKAEQTLASTLARCYETTSPDEQWELIAPACLKADGDPRAIGSYCSEGFIKRHPEAQAPLIWLQQQAVALMDQLACVEVARVSAATIWVAEALLDIYRQRKEATGQLDYDDLIVGALRLLNDPAYAGWVTTKLGYGIRHLLLDEAQDTSPAQWQLTEKLIKELYHPDVNTTPRTLFVVGDAKQSIYRFQGAAPEYFHIEQQNYAEWFAATDQPMRELALETSFRSSEPVLALVDAVCALPHAASALGEYQVSHRPHRSTAAGRVELWPLIARETREIPAPWELDAPLYQHPGSYQQLASQIATTIRRWLDEERSLESQGRPVVAGDILILVRRRNALVDALTAALMREAIPVAGADRIALNNHLAIQDLLAIARWCLMPADDLTLATVLKSPWFNYDDAALYALAYPRGDAPLWAWMQQAGDCYSDDVATLRSLRQAAEQLPPHRFFEQLLHGLCGQQELVARFGNEAIDVCSELLNQALTYQANHAATLQGFVDWMSKSDSVIKRELDTHANAVRIMTVHSAKGLQAPIVMLPDTTGTPPLRETLWWDWVAGHSTPYLVPTGLKPPARIRELKALTRTADMEEYVRLLYVALTRAEDELYICGTQSGKKGSDANWYDLVSEAMAALPEAIATPSEQGTHWRLHRAQQGEAPLRPAPTPTAHSPLPAWAKPQRYPIAMPLPFQPQATASNTDAAQRGTHLHRLLEWMPPFDTALTRDQIAQATAWLCTGTTPSEQEDLTQHIWQLRHAEHLAWVFAAGSRAEVPVATADETRRIDRLVITDDTIHIIDFKSDQAVPASIHEVPPAYHEQMQRYHQLIAPQFTSKKVRCWLLWIATAQLTELEPETVG